MDAFVTRTPSKKMRQMSLGGSAIETPLKTGYEGQPGDHNRVMQSCGWHVFFSTAPPPRPMSSPYRPPKVISPRISMWLLQLDQLP
jgi:hypothetical protein